MTEPRNALQELGEIVRAAVHQSSETVLPEHGFWFYRPTKNWPPPTVRTPQQLVPGERLCLACTQTDLKPAAQRRLVQEWCELLPTLADVKVLWLPSKVTPELFAAACAMPNLESLYVKWSGVTDFTPITQLQALRHLHMGSSPSLEPLDVLAQLPHLEWLELANMRALADISFLEKLPGLVGLRLQGDTNSSKAITTQTLRPLANLKSLRWLSLAAFASADGSLEPLAQLPALKFLLLNNRFTMEQVAWLAGRMPHVQCDLFEPVGPVVNWSTCKRCKQKNMVMVTGKGMPMFCLTCDEKKVTHHREAFARAVAQARTNP